MFRVVGAEGGDIVQRRQPTHQEASADNDKEGERLRKRPLQLKNKKKKPSTQLDNRGPAKRSKKICASDRLSTPKGNSTTTYSKDFAQARQLLDAGRGGAPARCVQAVERGLAFQRGTLRSQAMWLGSDRRRCHEQHVHVRPLCAGGSRETQGRESKSVSLDKAAPGPATSSWHSPSLSARALTQSEWQICSDRILVRVLCFLYTRGIHKGFMYT